MSYPNQCSASGISCPAITYYSNPNRTYAGLPTGVPVGMAGAAFAARKLRENRLGIAAFR